MSQKGLKTSELQNYSLPFMSNRSQRYEYANHRPWVYKTATKYANLPPTGWDEAQADDAFTLQTVPVCNVKDYCNALGRNKY